MKNKLDITHIINNWPSNLDGHLHYCIGLSGGIDSVVLLHLFTQISHHKPIRLSAIHINHGISPNASNWAEFCTRLCQQLSVPLTTCSTKIEKIAGEGLENSARKYRYQQYKLDHAEVIILAHHQDDQIETMLSQLMRGSNLHNSAGMLAVSRKDYKYYWRPLLNISKQQILDYALEHKLEHIEDESNQDNQYLRNFIRNDILPQLIKYDANIKTKFMQSIREIQNSVQLIDELAEIDYINCSEDSLLRKSKFSMLAHHRQLNVLTYFIRKNNLPLPSSKQLSEFIRQVSTAHSSKMPKLKISNQVVLMARNDYIRLVSELEIN